MNEFLAAALTMPTAIFSALLGLAILYWLLVVLGLFDLSIFDGLFEGSVEGAVEGVAEGVAEGLAEGAADSASEATLGDHQGCLSLLAIGDVPVSISGTLLLIFGWLFSYGGTTLVAGVVAGGALLTVGIGVAAFALAIGATALAVKPLRRIFRMAPVTMRRDLIKRICKLTTLRVDERFGQAEVDDDGAPLLIQVRCRRENDMTRGDRAIIYEYDATNEVFWIAPLDKDLSETYKAHGPKALGGKAR